MITLLNRYICNTHFLNKKIVSSDKLELVVVMFDLYTDVLRFL